MLYNKFLKSVYSRKRDMILIIHIKLKGDYFIR